MAPTASTRQLILEAIKTRLEAIEMGDDFLTDAGAAVFLGFEPPFGPDDPDVAIAITVGVDSRQSGQANVQGRLPIQIAAIAKADLTEPWVAVESVLADIKRAVELEDRTLGGLVNHRLERGDTETLARDAGATTVGCVITYLADYVEGWGTP
jgi:hypothetical protein